MTYDDFWTRYFFRAERMASGKADGGMSFPPDGRKKRERERERERERARWRRDPQRPPSGREGFFPSPSSRKMPHHCSVCFVVLSCGAEFVSAKAAEKINSPIHASEPINKTTRHPQRSTNQQRRPPFPAHTALLHVSLVLPITSCFPDGPSIPDEGEDEEEFGWGEDDQDDDNDNDNADGRGRDPPSPDSPPHPRGGPAGGALGAMLPASEAADEGRAAPPSEAAEAAAAAAAAPTSAGSGSGSGGVKTLASAAAMAEIARLTAALRESEAERALLAGAGGAGGSRDAAAKSDDDDDDDGGVDDGKVEDLTRQRDAAAAEVRRHWRIVKRMWV